MIELQAIEKALVVWLSAVTGRPVLIVNQRAPRPPYPYLTLRLAPETPTTDEVRREDAGEDDVRLVVRGERVLSASINCYAKAAGTSQGAAAIMSRVRTSLALPSVLAELFEGGISFVDSGPIQDLSWLQDAEFIDRRQMDVRFAVVASAEETVEAIKTVGIEMEEVA